MTTAASPHELSELARQLYSQSADGRAAEVELAGRKASRAERPLRWIAIVHTIGTLALIGLAQNRVAAGDSTFERVAVIHAVVTLGYWAIWCWSFAAPLPASIVGLLLMTSMSYAECAATGRSGHSGFGGMPAITMGLLIRAIYNGWRQRVLSLDAALDPTQPKPRTRSIVSPIVLYLVLLTIVATPLSLAARHDLTIKDVLDIHKFMAIVIATWAILSWREVLPVIGTIGSINWLATAVVFGLGTFVVASIYGDLLGFFSGMPPVKASAGFLSDGYSWLAILGLTAVFPAIFEELAFRGIIVPGLARVLTEKETIAVSGMMFMILHLSVPSVPHLLLLGILVGYVRLRSKSIWPCVLMHFTHNAMCIAFERWM